MGLLASIRRLLLCLFLGAAILSQWGSAAEVKRGVLEVRCEVSPTNEIRCAVWVREPERADAESDRLSGWWDRFYIAFPAQWPFPADSQEPFPTPARSFTSAYFVLMEEGSDEEIAWIPLRVNRSSGALTTSVICAPSVAERSSCMFWYEEPSEQRVLIVRLSSYVKQRPYHTTLMSITESDLMRDKSFSSEFGPMVYAIKHSHWDDALRSIETLQKKTDDQHVKCRRALAYLHSRCRQARQTPKVVAEERDLP
jgi:hypothetical protein